MMLKITKRRNGRRMATLVTRHNLGGAEIASILARFGNVHGSDALPDVYTKTHDGATLTRTQVERIVRLAVTDWGVDAYSPESGWDPDGNYTERETAIIATWAASQVRRLYPELDDPALAEFVSQGG